MGVSISSVGRNGVHDYLLVRATAVIISVYSLYLMWFFISTPVVTYFDWLELFQDPLMKVSTVLTLIALLVHAWIGTWQVLTDYVKPTFLRGSLQLICVVVLLAYVIFGNMIIWSV
tara:strand:- start:8902 stop:9249 length:348 start_codon:yes stop_codon:yes gene_type:complete